MSATSVDEADYAEQIDVTESVAFSALTTTEFTVEDTIYIEEDYEAEINEYSGYCFPYGGTSNTPVFYLQQRLKPAGATWGAWTTIQSYELSWTRGEMQPAFEWQPIEHKTSPPKMMQSGKWRLYASMMYFQYDLTVESYFCDQQYLQFGLNYLFNWYQNCPTDDTEQRRILFYPTGTSGEDIYGNAVDPVIVIFKDYPKVRRLNGKYGAYRISATLLTRHFTHDKDDTYDIDSSDTGGYQGAITWSDL